MNSRDGGAALIDEPEIAVVGGGIGGTALATVLARRGLTVVVLERDIRPVDRVRGEFMAPVWSSFGYVERLFETLVRVANDETPGGAEPRMTRRQ